MGLPTHCMMCRKLCTHYKCVRCLTTSYCSEYCAEQHWIVRHHLECKPKRLNVIAPDGELAEHDI